MGVPLQWIVSGVKVVQHKAFITVTRGRSNASVILDISKPHAITVLNQTRGVERSELLM